MHAVYTTAPKTLIATTRGWRLDARCSEASAGTRAVARRARRTLAASAIAWVTFATLAMPCAAQTTYFVETSKAIARLGAQGRSFCVGFVEPLTQNCLYNVYISSDTKGQYAQLLASKLSNKRLSRVDYS